MTTYQLQLQLHAMRVQLFQTFTQLIALKYACCMADLGGAAGGQPSYMQMAPPPVHPGAPVTDRGFTGPGGAAGGARRKLAGKLFERQHSLQDPSFDPVSQKLGLDEVTFGLTYLLASVYGLCLNTLAWMR